MVSLKTASILLIALLAAAVLVAACSQRYVCPDGTVAGSAAECPAAQPAPTPEQAATPNETQATPPPSAPPTVTMDPALQALIALHETKVKSMMFIYAPIVQTSTGVAVQEEGTYYIKGTLAKVTVPTPTKFDAKTFVDTVYLDLATKTARGFCMNRVLGVCSIQGDERPADYATYAIKLPTDWLSEIPPDATLLGTQSFDSHQVQEVRYAAGGKYYRLYIDQFTGVPLRVGIYADSDYGQLVGGVEYHDFSANTVKDSDVTPPQ